MIYWFWRRGLLNFVNVVYNFFFSLPFEHGVSFHLNKIESTSTKDALCQIWLELALCFWRRRFSYTPVSSVWKDRGPLFEQTWISFSQRYQICQEWLKLSHGFWSRTILNFVIAFLLFRYHLPLEKGLGLLLEQTWTTVIQTRCMSI